MAKPIIICDYVARHPVKTAGAVVEQQKQVIETAPRMLGGAAHAIDTRA